MKDWRIQDIPTHTATGKSVDDLTPAKLPANRPIDITMTIANHIGLMAASCNGIRDLTINKCTPELILQDWANGYYALTALRKLDVQLGVIRGVSNKTTLMYPEGKRTNRVILYDVDDENNQSVQDFASPYDSLLYAQTALSMLEMTETPLAPNGLRAAPQPGIPFGPVPRRQPGRSKGTMERPERTTARPAQTARARCSQRQLLEERPASRRTLHGNRHKCHACL